MKLREFPLLTDENIDARFTIETVQTLLGADPDVLPPFVLVAKRAGNNVAIRVRHLGP